MPTAVAANNTAGAISTSDTGAPIADCELSPKIAGRNRDPQHDTRTNGAIQDLSETESTPRDGGSTNIIPESDGSRRSLTLTSSSPQTPLAVPQAESCLDSNKAEQQSDETQASSGSTATGNSRLADKRKRGKHIPVRSSLAEALSEQDGLVLKFGMNTEETLQRIVYRSKLANSTLLPSKSTTWSYRKLFSDDDGFIAAGLVFIHPYGEKPLKNVKDNAYVFFVIEGVVEVRIHKSSYTVPSGGSFMVPRGNNYSFKNLSNHDARIFFCQARKVSMSENEELARNSLLPIRHDSPPASKAAILAMWLLQRLVAQLWRLRDRLLMWYAKNLAKYERFATRRRLYLLFFMLGLMTRRLPFVGSPPLINIQFIRVI